LRKSRVAATAAGMGGLGYGIGQLKSGDLTHLLDKTLGILKEQGPYAFFSLFITVLIAVMLVAFVKFVAGRTQTEIDRVCSERDKFQKLFIEKWESSNKLEQAPSRKDESKSSKKGGHK
jgi:hypothetical protein